MVSFDDTKHLRIGVYFSMITLECQDAMLIKLDNDLPMDEIIPYLCSIGGVSYEPGKYGLWYEGNSINGTRYINDENKNSIQNGSILTLKESAEILAGNLYKSLNELGSRALKDVAEASEDIVILKLLNNYHVDLFVRELCFQQADHGTWIAGLTILNNLYKHKLVKKIPSKIVYRLLHILGDRNMRFPNELTLISIRIILLLRRYRRISIKESIYGHLHELLNSNVRDLQEASLQLLCYLVIFPIDRMDEQTAMDNVVCAKVVRTIYTKIIINQGQLTKTMQQQIYIFQTLMFRRYWSKKVTKLSLTDPCFEAIRTTSQKARKDFVPPRTILPCNDHRYHPRSKLLQNLRTSFRKSREELLNSSRLLRALSPSRRPRRMSNFYLEEDNPFVNLTFEFDGPIHYVDSLEETISSKDESKTVSKASSLSNLPDEVTREIGQVSEGNVRGGISLLTAENLLYLAENDPALFHKMNLHKSSRYNLANKITLELCRILEVGKPRQVDSPGENYHPLAFDWFPDFIQKLFCVAISQYEKTYHEMKARVESDEPKVIAVLRQQIEYVLGSKPQSLENLQLIMAGTTYEIVAEKRLAEMRERLKQDFLHKPLFLDYRNQRRPVIVKMIRDHRMKFMIRGQRLYKVSNKGEILKTETSLLSFNKGTNCLIIKGVVDLHPSNIEDVEIGKRSQFYRDVRKYHDENEPFFKAWQTTDDQESWALLLSIRSSDGKNYNLCAQSHKELDYWEDGINILRKKVMSSNSYNEEVQQFLDMEVRLHFLDLEGLPIPDTAPEVPEPPTDYNFHFKKDLPLVDRKTISRNLKV